MDFKKRSKGTFGSVHELLRPEQSLITSSDATIRKKARSLRIERRLEAFRRSTAPEDDDESDEDMVTADPVMLQIDTSATTIEKHTIEGKEFITNVRIASDSREVDRREYLGLGRDKLLKQLDEEAFAAEEQFNEIAEKWSSIEKYNDPLHIHDAIVEQKEKCTLLIKEKDDLIAMLKDEIKTAELNFCNDQKSQMEDVNTLTSRIENQISYMKKIYDDELQLIEDVMLSQRQLLLDNNNAIWENLYMERDAEEELNAQKKFEQIENFEKQMTKLRNEFQENYRATKIKLENNIEQTQRELERIKALALMNSEKLDYNYQILKRREGENIIIKSQQKRRINKLQDAINLMRNKISDYESTSNRQISKLEENITKLQANVLEVESKADYFASINEKNFQLLWDMNKNTAGVILQRILDTDKILHEQQLGLDWLPPTMNLIDKKFLASYKSAVAMVTSGEIDESKVVIKLGNSTEASEATEENKNSSCYISLIKRLLLKISDKSGFLADKKIKMLLDKYTADEKALIRVDQIFEALYIKDKEAIDLLVKYFLPYTHCPVCTLRGQSIDSDLASVKTIGSIGSHMLGFRNTEDQDEGVALEELMSEGVRQPDNLIDQLLEGVVDYHSELSFGIISLDSASALTDNTVCTPALPKFFTRKSRNDSIKYKEEQKQTKMSKISFKKNTTVLTCFQKHPLMISSIYVTQALQKFIQDYHIKEEYMPTIQDRMQKRRITISRLITKKDMINFWERYKNVLTKEKEQLWDGLFEGLKKYQAILKDRKILSEEVVDFRRKNAELKRLLSNYTDCGILIGENPCNET